MRNIPSVAGLLFSFSLLASCGTTLTPGPELTGLNQKQVDAINSEVLNITFICGQDLEISDERKNEFEAGLVDILKKPLGGSAKIKAIQKRVSGWKTTNPDYESYLGCVDRRMAENLDELEKRINELESENTALADEKWVSDVALHRMNEELGKWRRYVNRDKWREFDTTEIDQILTNLKKKARLV